MTKGDTWPGGSTGSWSKPLISSPLAKDAPKRVSFSPVPSTVHSLAGAPIRRASFMPDLPRSLVVPASAQPKASSRMRRVSLTTSRGRSSKRVASANCASVSMSVPGASCVARAFTA